MEVLQPALGNKGVSAVVAADAPYSNSFSKASSQELLLSQSASAMSAAGSFAQSTQGLTFRCKVKQVRDCYEKSRFTVVLYLVQKLSQK